MTKGPGRKKSRIGALRSYLSTNDTVTKDEARIKLNIPESSLTDYIRRLNKQGWDIRVSTDNCRIHFNGIFDPNRKTTNPITYEVHNRL